MTPGITYLGPSMNPTLKAGDRLTVVPYENGKIRAGDVIVFRDPHKRIRVCHRVVRSLGPRVKTMGDNNYGMDPCMLGKDDILGRVVAVKRGNLDLTIHGGLKGAASGLFHRTRKRLDAALSRPLNPIYHTLARSGVCWGLRRFLPETRILRFHKARGVELQLVMGGRVIGRRPPATRRWEIERPFRLFFNDGSLPS